MNYSNIVFMRSGGFNKLQQILEEKEEEKD